MCILLSGWAAAPRAGGAQDIAVEWLEFECGGERCLILNAYRTAVADLTDSGAQEREASLSPDKIAPVLLKLPITTAPEKAVLDSFLDILGIPDLRALVEATADHAEGSSKSTDHALWRGLVSELRSRKDVRLGKSHVRSTEVSDQLKRVYAGQGYPSEKQPILPHLVRGVLATIDGRGVVSDTVRTLEFGAVEFGESLTTRLGFANLGSRPLHVYASGGLFSGARLEEAEFVLGPGQHLDRQLRYEPTLASILTGRGSVIVEYESGGERLVVLDAKGTHSPSLPGILTSVVGIEIKTHVGFWRELPLYRFAFFLIAVGTGILLVLTGGRAMPVAAAHARGLRSSWRNVGSGLRRGGGAAAAGAAERTASLFRRAIRAYSWVAASRKRLIPLLSSLAGHLRALTKIAEARWNTVKAKQQAQQGLPNYGEVRTEHEDVSSPAQAASNPDQEENLLRGKRPDFQRAANAETEASYTQERGPVILTELDPLAAEVLGARGGASSWAAPPPGTLQRRRLLGMARYRFGALFFFSAVILSAIFIYKFQTQDRSSEDFIKPMNIDLAGATRFGVAQAAPANTSDFAVATYPAGATVLLDFDSVGTTPLQGHRLNDGAHILSVHKDGYAPLDTVVFVIDGVMPQLAFILEATDPAGTSALSVASHPAGATVFVDFDSVGTTPLQADKLNDGAYLLSVRKEGYAAVDTFFVIIDGVMPRLAFLLEEAAD